MSLFHYYEQKDDVMRVNMSWIFFCIEFRRVQYKMDKHDDDMTITMTSDMACLHWRWIEWINFFTYTIEVREDEMRRHQKLEIIIVNS